MNRDSGRALSGVAHLRQSIADILSTPIGSRAMRRDYGSQLAELIDQPFNDVTRLRAYSAIVTALARWEKRLRLSRVQLAPGETLGSAIIDITGVEVDTNAALNLQIPQQLGGVV